MNNHWLSYGAGVNSTALLVLLCEDPRGRAFLPFRVVFCDTQDESEKTYDYLYSVAMPYARRHGITIEVCRPKEGVLERAERLKVTISRTLRTCTQHGKIYPLRDYLKAFADDDDLRIVGIHAGESHRARPAPHGERGKVYPLVDWEIDQEGCLEAIRKAGLSAPPKSGCWMCPYLRVGQILEMARDEVDRMRRIVRLEMVATETHGLDSKGRPRTQWGDKPAKEWAARSCDENSAGMFAEVEPDPPCACFDG